MSQPLRGRGVEEILPTNEGGTRGVIVTVERNGHSGPSSNPVCISRSANTPGNTSNYTLSCYGEIVGQIGLSDLCMVTGLGEEKLWIQIWLCVKIVLVSHPARAEALSIYIYIYIYIYICKFYIYIYIYKLYIWFTYIYIYIIYIYIYNLHTHTHTHIYKLHI